MWKQFVDYAGGILKGDFGTSIVSKTPVLHEFITLFPATLELTICAMLFASLIGIPAGVFAAARRGGIYDQTLMGVALTGYSMPIFWWGLILILVMSNTLGLTPVSGRVDLIKYYYQPVTALPSSTHFSPARRAPSGMHSITSSCRRSCSAPCRWP